MILNKCILIGLVYLLLNFGTSVIIMGQDHSDLYLGSGAKAGEITNNSAIIHVRLTKIPRQNKHMLIPGTEGIVRIRYAANPSISESFVTQERQVSPKGDFSTQFKVKGLAAATRYYYVAEYRKLNSGEFKTSAIHSFLTAPDPKDRSHVRFQVTTCQDYRGQSTYTYMLEESPDFLVSAGDNVYYDGAGNAHNVQQAYTAYQKMFGLPLMKRYFRSVGAYFLKDDHDYRFNDGDKWAEKGVGWNRSVHPSLIVNGQEWLTHAEGIRVFKEVFPISDPTYRTFRWGKGVQIWLLEGRDYRSRNDDEDGPDKTIWGSEQKEWLKSTLLQSDADWRIIISPTPIIGPDDFNKTDNHANVEGFWYEGSEFLDWLRDENLDNVIIICGDRHWQYHSRDLRNSRDIHEFCCGPTCNQHAVDVPPMLEVDEFKGIVQPYTANQGGFLTAEYSPDGKLQIRFKSIEGEVLYQTSFSPNQ